MKRALLLLGASIAITSISAQTLLNDDLPYPGVKFNEKIANKRVATRGDVEYLNFGYCYELYTALGAGIAGATIGAAIEIPGEIAQQWIGSKLTGIEIGFGISSYTEVTAFVTKNLSGDPVYTQSATMEQASWNNLMLDQPYVIDGETFFVGYSTICPEKSDYPVGVDYVMSTSPQYGDWMGVNNDWDHYAAYFGNVCIRLLLEGENLPRYDAVVSNLFVPEVVPQGEPFSAYFFIRNNGVETIENVTVDVKINGEVVTTKEATASNPIESGGFDRIYVNDIIFEETGLNIPVELCVTEVNGHPDDSPINNTVEGVGACSDLTFNKGVLVEEFTGTWCGWCPRGIVGMQYMHENYAKDGFIGIGVHYNDEMVSSSYVEIARAFSGGAYPSAIIQRTYYFSPSAADMEEYFLIIKESPWAYADVLATAVYDPDQEKILIDGETVFGFDLQNINCSVAFALVEDNVGPYMQTNSFPSSKDEYLEGWSDAGSKVRTFYNEVGREIVDPFGIEGSVPVNVVKGEGYPVQAQLDVLSDYDVNNCYVVSMIFDNSTYQILNAAKLPIEGISGAETLEKEKTSIYNVYNLQGVKILETKAIKVVDNLPKNIYIVNGKKVLLGK